MREVTPATSMYAVNEVRRHLLTELQHRQFDGLLAKMRIVADADERVIPRNIDLPSKDRPILAAAIAARVDFLVTGDTTHFGKLYERRGTGVTIILPSEFLARNAYRLTA